MRVANPIYDVVFKYLLGDLRIVKLILFKILDELESLERTVLKRNKIIEEKDKALAKAIRLNNTITLAISE